MCSFELGFADDSLSLANMSAFLRYLSTGYLELLL